MNLVETIGTWLKKKPAELTLEDVRMAIPQVKRKADEWERDALAREQESLQLREQAFSPGSTPTDQALLIRKAKSKAAAAAQMVSQAGLFIQHLANLRALETAMQIANELKAVGLVSANATVEDWQTEIDNMAMEIENLVEAMRQMHQVIADALPAASVETEPAQVRAEQRELEELFTRYNETKDPAEREKIRGEIERIVALPA